MRHLIGSILAISVATVAAIAATTALLNAPMHIGPATGSTPATTSQPGQAAADNKEIPDAPPPKGATAPPTTAPDAPAAPASVDPVTGKPAADGEKPEEADSDPYDGIAPEDLPPDLQYDADASVSFPTNT